MHLIVNRATRQWAKLSALAPPHCSWSSVVGFYFHPPSGEYRVIGRHQLPGVLHSRDRCRLSAATNHHDRTDAELLRIRSLSTVTFRGRLYWLRHNKDEGDGVVVAFDTLSETFHQVPPPTTGPGKKVNLLDIEGTGTPAVSAFEASVLDILVINDYESGRPARRWWRCPPGQHQPRSCRTVRHEEEDGREGGQPRWLQVRGGGASAL